MPLVPDTHHPSKASSPSAHSSLKNESAGGGGTSTSAGATDPLTNEDSFQVPKSVLSASRARLAALAERKMQRLASTSDTGVIDEPSASTVQVQKPNIKTKDPPPRSQAKSNLPNTRDAPRSAGFMPAQLVQVQGGGAPLGANGKPNNGGGIGNGTAPPPTGSTASHQTKTLSRSNSPSRPLALGSPPRGPISASVSASPIASPPPPDRTLHKIQRLEAARALRREANAAQQALLRGLSPQERDTAKFRDDVGRFRAEFDRAWHEWEAGKAVGETGGGGAGAGDGTSERVPRKEEDQDSAKDPTGVVPTALVPSALRPLRSPKIRVCIRKRPLNAKELSSHSPDSLTVRTSSHPNAHIYVHRPHRRLDGTPATTTHRFLFDDVFDEHASNLLVYSAAVRPLVRAMFKRGGRCSLFCYGQTGSGKTYTVFGPEGGRPGAPGDPGIHQHACADIFRLLSLANRRRAPRNLPALNCTASYFELYGGRVFDLLARRAPRQMMEDARGDVQVVGLTRVRVGSAEECRRQVERGNTERTTGRTEANDTSSRSHAVFQVVVWESGAGVGELDGVGGTVLPGGDKVFSKFSLIDLAGSERGQDTGKGGTRRQRMEASEINKSLLALKECIRALHARQRYLSQSNSGLPSVSFSSPASGPVCPPHVPFRASKLTHLLRDSFVHRSSRTVMVAAVGPSAGGVEHTLNTLRYAGRVKEGVGVGGESGGSGGEDGSVSGPGQGGETIVDSPEAISGWGAGRDGEGAEGDEMWDEDATDGGGVDEEEDCEPGEERLIEPDEDEVGLGDPDDDEPSEVISIPVEPMASPKAQKRNGAPGSPSRQPLPQAGSRSRRNPASSPRAKSEESILASKAPGVALRGSRKGSLVGSRGPLGGSGVTGGSTASLAAAGTTKTGPDRKGAAKGAAGSGVMAGAKRGAEVGGTFDGERIVEMTEELVARHLAVLDHEMSLCRSDETLLTRVTASPRSRADVLAYVAGMEANLRDKVEMLRGLGERVEGVKKAIG